MEEACGIALGETKKALENYPEITRVIYALFGDDALKVYQEAFRRIFP
jgi:hypothetical protein